MKKHLMFFLVLIAFAQVGFSQAKNMQVVFDITSKDTADHQAILRHAGGTAKSYDNIKVEVVIFSGAINMVVKDKSVVADAIRNLASQKNISFKVCAVTMKRYGITKEDLIPGVEVVPDAILEIISKQAEGWSYIKEAH